MDLSRSDCRAIVAADARDCGAKLPGVGLGWQSAMRWGTAGAFSNLYASIEEDMGRVDYPFLLLHDPGDKVCFISGSQKLMQLSPSKDKELREMDCGGYHTMCLVSQDEFVSALAA